jgi:hypothetical protein
MYWQPVLGSAVDADSHQGVKVGIGWTAEVQSETAEKPLCAPIAAIFQWLYAVRNLEHSSKNFSKAAVSSMST